MIVLAMMLFVGLVGCGTNGSSPNPGLGANVSTGKVVFAIQFASKDAAKTVHGGTLNATMANVVAKQKTKVRAVSIETYTEDGISLPRQDFPVVDGALKAELNLPAGSAYWFTLSCMDSDGIELFSGYSDTKMITAEKEAVMTVNLDMNPVLVNFAITGMVGSFDKSSNGDGASYQVDYVVGDQCQDADYWAFVDTTSALHFVAGMQIYPGMPPKVFVTIKDNSGAAITQSLGIDSTQLLNAIVSESEITFAYQPVGLASVVVKFPGE